jgi:hypothetical protein
MAKKASKTKSVKKSKGFNRKEFSLFMLAFAVVGGFTLWISLAAPHNGGGGGGKPSGGGGTISLVLPPDTDKNADGLPNFSDSVSFNISTTATTQPFVNLLCYQNGVLVASGWRGYFVGSLDYPNRSFGLSSGGWTSGAADCTATLGYYNSHGKFASLATTSFHVSA